MATAKHKLARQLNTGDKVILKDGKASVKDIIDVKSKGVAGPSGHIVVIEVENLEGSKRGEIIKFPVFSEEQIELVPKKEKKKSLWRRFLNLFKRK